VASGLSVSAAAPQPRVLHGLPGGVSWQARLLNAFFRQAIKRPIRKGPLSPRAVRSVVCLLEMMSLRLADFATVHPHHIAGVPCDVVVPLNPPPTERVVLYLHGGGFFAHLPRSYRRFARRLAEAMGATVYLPAYRLTPEHRYPAATDDCMAVYRALLADGCDHGRFGRRQPGPGDAAARTR
jgi:epsilon-lactone hydrolase